MVRCNAAWLLFKADGLALRGNCFPSAMQALNGCLNAVDGVKGQRAAYTACFVAEPAELASRKTLARKARRPPTYTKKPGNVSQRCGISS